MRQLVEAHVVELPIIALRGGRPGAGEATWPPARPRRERARSRPASRAHATKPLNPGDLVELIVTLPRL